jgi:IclR family acetate operon transcriptional repressor
MSVDEHRTRSPVEAIDRASLLLIRLSEAGPEGMALADLAAATGMHKATAHRALQALRLRDFAEQVDGRYRLGTVAARLGEGFTADEHLAPQLHPALVSLSARTQELVHAGVLEGAHVRYIDKVEPERTIRVWSAVGGTVPAAVSAMGRALLAAGGVSREQVEVFTRAADPALRVDPDHVWDVLEQARARGCAWEVDENEPGIACIGMPVLRGGRAVAAVSITAPAERMTPERREALRIAMREELAALLPAPLTIQD